MLEETVLSKRAIRVDFPCNYKIGPLHILSKFFCPFVLHCLSPDWSKASFVIIIFSKEFFSSDDAGRAAKVNPIRCFPPICIRGPQFSFEYWLRGGFWGLWLSGAVGNTPNPFRLRQSFYQTQHQTVKIDDVFFQIILTFGIDKAFTVCRYFDESSLVLTLLWYSMDESMIIGSYCSSALNHPKDWILSKKLLQHGAQEEKKKELMLTCRIYRRTLELYKI